MFFDARGMRQSDLEDLQLGALTEPVTAGQFLNVVNRAARALYEALAAVTHIRVGTITTLTVGPPLTVTVLPAAGDPKPLVCRYQLGLAPVVGDVVFTLTEAGFTYVTGKLA